MSFAISQQPVSISPGAFMRLSLRSTRAQLIFRQALAPVGSVFAVRDQFVMLFHGLYGTHLPDRAGVVFASGTGELGHSITLAAIRHRAELDVLVPIANDPGEAKIDVGEALRLAQQTRRVIIPIGIGCGACWPLLLASIPMPGTRIVAITEAPFEVPDQPQAMPDVWGDTIIRLLKQADGRAKDHLATWRKSGRLDL